MMAFGPATPASSYRCQNHPDRAGIGICVRCRRVVCAECATKIDRMNFCTQCLAAVQAGPRARPIDASGGGAGRGVALLLVVYLALAALFTLFGYGLAVWGIPR